MHDRESERKAIRTVRRKKVQDLLAVLFFLLLLPYTCSVLTTEPVENSGEDAVEASAAASKSSASADSRHYVLWEKGNGVWKIPLEEFLVGALAGTIPGEYREETIKAQAVILRSTSLASQENSVAALSYLDSEERRQLWQENFEEYEMKFKKAVQVTAGIVLLFEKKIVSPPFFRLSAGQTRNSSQIWEDERFVWCASVECPHNLEAAEYLKTITVKRNDFINTMEREGIALSGKGDRMILKRDSAGYVLLVECGGQCIEGERFRALFELPSSNFTIREEGNKLFFTTRGIGHGLGFDQYAANLLAGSGQDYQKLLNTFFNGLTLEKVE